MDWLMLDTFYYIRIISTTNNNYSKNKKRLALEDNQVHYNFY